MANAGGKRYFKYFVLAILSLWVVSCKKSPSDGVKLIVNSDFISYRVSIKIEDAADASKVPTNSYVNITGPNANLIYNSFGKRDFTVRDGQVDLGINPAFNPVGGAPVVFNVQIYADGFLPDTKHISISADQHNGTITAKLINTSAPPAGVQILQKEFSLNAGKMPATSVLQIGSGVPSGSSIGGNLKALAATPPSPIGPTVPIDTAYYDNSNTTLVMPKGMTFFYAPDGSTIFSSMPQGGRISNYNQIIGAITNKVTYTGSYLRAVLTYSPQVWDNKTQVFDYSSSSYASNPPVTGGISTLKGVNNPAANLPEDQLFYQSAVKQSLTGIRFIGRIVIGGQLRDVDIIPSSDYPWYTSYRLDKTFANPVTNRAIQPGDSIEIGIDPVNRKTLRTAIIQTGMNDYTVQIQGYNAGYYVNAPYTLDCNYTVDASTELTDTRGSGYILNNAIGTQASYKYSLADVTNAIPDYDNIYTNFSFYFRPVNYSYYNSYQVAPFTSQAFKFKIISSSPIDKSALQVTASSSYWSISNDVAVISGAVSGNLKPLAGITQKLYPLVTIDGTLSCPNSSLLTIKPTYDYYLPGYKNYYGLVRFVNGLWSTRSLPPGYIWQYTVYTNNKTISFADTVSSKYQVGSYYYIKKTQKIDDCSAFGQ